MSHQRLTRNALLAVAQVVVSGIVLLVMYGYLIRVIGLEQLGIWAIVLATASVSKISELGFTGSAVKFTAKYVALGDRAKVADVMQTTVITVGAALMVVLTAGYPVIAILMKLVIPVEHILLALNILPYVLVSLWVSSVAGVFLSGLDGCQRIDLRAIVVMFSAILFLILTYLVFVLTSFIFNPNLLIHEKVRRINASLFLSGPMCQTAYPIPAEVHLQRCRDDLA